MDPEIGQVGANRSVRDCSRVQALGTTSVPLFFLERIMAMGSRFVDALVFALPDHRRTRQAPRWYFAVLHLRVHM